MTNRRDFLQTTAAITGSLLLRKSLLAATDHRFHFVHSDTLNHWPLADPVQWSLQNAHEPILARAAEGLSKLTADDGDRIIRLVVRRCSLNLIERQSGKIMVHYWGLNRADLKPFFKTHGLVRPEIDVLLRDRKNETILTLTGDSFLYGFPIASDFDLELFKFKWMRRFSIEPDDELAAPGTSSLFAWNGLQDGFIPWAAMKSAWRSSSGVCLNCSGETLLVNFGLRQVGMFNRSGFITHVCGTCHLSFRDESVDVNEWMAVNLDAEVWPEAELVWGRRIARTTKGRT